MTYNNDANYSSEKHELENIEFYTKNIENCLQNLEQFYFYRAGCYYRLKNYEKAIQDFDMMTHINPDACLGYAGSADIYVEQERYKEALENYNKIISINPDFALKLSPEFGKSYAFCKRGSIYHKLKEYDKAINDFSIAIEIENIDRIIEFAKDSIEKIKSDKSKEA